MLIKLSTITSALAWLIIPFESLGGQVPISSTSISKGTRFNITEQDQFICDAGSRQWTGWVHVSKEKSLFFCMDEFLATYRIDADCLRGFFESRSKPTTDPVILWLNGCVISFI